MQCRAEYHVQSVCQKTSKGTRKHTKVFRVKRKLCICKNAMNGNVKSVKGWPRKGFAPFA
nr:MAG TPA_asm: hypothetical protein [Caudoviricetes sp.]